MKPCDCRSEEDTKKLDVQGIAQNDWSISISPNSVIVGNRYFGIVKIPMSIFKIFAEWYLEEQKLKRDE